MSDILASLWMSIDKFNYQDIDKLTITNYDVNNLIISRRNFVLKPGMCLLVTMIFSRYRSRLWSFAKDYFLGNRRAINIYKSKGEVTNSNMSDKEEVLIEYKNEQTFGDVDESNKFALSNARKLNQRRAKNEVEFMRITREEPTYSKEYLGFLSRYGQNVKKFNFFKKYTDRFTAQEKVLHSGENFLMKTKLIYLPFLLILIFSTYDLVVNYVGFYFKYQPLIDEFYSQKIK
jgi:hypothetical protein